MHSVTVQRVTIQCIRAQVVTKLNVPIECQITGSHNSCFIIVSQFIVSQ